MAETGPDPTKEPLSRFEISILERCCSGETDLEIARAISISPHTVRRIFSEIMRKLSAKTKTHAAALWCLEMQSAALMDLEGQIAEKAHQAGQVLRRKK